MARPVVRRFRTGWRTRAVSHALLAAALLAVSACWQGDLAFDAGQGVAVCRAEADDSKSSRCVPEGAPLAPLRATVADALAARELTTLAGAIGPFDAGEVAVGVAQTLTLGLVSSGLEAARVGATGASLTGLAGTAPGGWVMAPPLPGAAIPLAGAEGVALFNVTLTPADVGPVAFVVALPVTGAGAGPRTLRFVITAQAVAPAGCTLAARPPEVLLGSVPAGAPNEARATLTVTNVGSADCYPTLLDGPHDAALTIEPARGTTAWFGVPIPPLPSRLGVGEVMVVPLRFAPTEAGPLADTLRFYHGATTTPLAVPVRGAATAPGDCLLEVDPGFTSEDRLSGLPMAPLAFGLVATNTIRERTLTIRHAAGSGNACVVESVTLLDGADAAFSVGAPPRFPMTLQVGESVAVPVRYAPLGADPKPVKAILRVATSAANQPVPRGALDAANPLRPAPSGFYFALTGMRVAAALECLPRQYDFGLTTIDCNSAPADVFCYNRGLEPVTVLRTETQGAASFSVLTMSPKPTAPGEPITIGPGEALTVKLRFRPSKPPRQETGQLRVMPEVGAAIEVPLVGWGEMGSFTQDVFDQPPIPKVDVLVAISNAASMADNQANVHTNMRQAGQYFSSLWGTEFQVGVVGADTAPVPYPSNSFGCGGIVGPGHLYACPGNPKWIDRRTPDVAKILFANSLIGTCCAPAKPLILDSVRLALSEPNVSDPAINGGFLRSDARLVAVLVSDADDGSPGDVGEYVSFLRALKGERNKDQFSMTVVAGFSTGSNPRPADCGANGESATAGTRLFDAWQQVGNGLALSLCDPNWGKVIFRSYADSFFAQVSFPLSRPADSSTITVELNGAPVPRDTDNSEVGWTYDSASNTVNFGKKTIPTKGSRIVVTYNSVCF